MIIIHILLISLCCLIIWKASDGFEVASEYIGRNLNDGVRGATINAIGSSMPELFTTIWFLFVLRDKDGFAAGIGTTAGSAIFNGMIIPAVVILAVIGYGLAKKVTVSKKVIWRDGLSLIFAELILIFVIKGDSLNWWHGLILMMVYAIYVIVMLTTMSSGSGKEEDEGNKEEDEGSGSEKSWLMCLLTLDLEPLFIKKEINNANAWSLLIVAMLVIGGACALLVIACEGLALGAGIKTYFVAVVLASAATSVPDTILSYRDAMAGEYDDAVANALGSNIFDVCFALGLPLFLFTIIYGPISMSPDTVENITELRVILLVSTIVAFVIYIFGDGMGKIKAYLLLAIYVLFTIFIASKAYEAAWAIEFGTFMRELLPQ
ncbi:MAG: Ca2+/Na+ antiporter [Polaribacter sp.]|jgi:Ca2+/Na+ antiporter